MGLFSKKAFEHTWKKRDVEILELKEKLEGNSSYTNNVLRKVSKKYLKYDKRGVSNLYLIKEVSDEGVVCAIYAFSIVSESIDEETLSNIRNVAMDKLSVGEMRARSFDQKPDDWWEQDTEAIIKRVENGNPDGFMDYLVAELSPKGIIFTARQVRKEKFANELECSAVVWGIKESGLRKGVKNRVIHNDCL